MLLKSPRRARRDSFGGSIVIQLHAYLLQGLGLPVGRDGRKAAAFAPLADP